MRSHTRTLALALVLVFASHAAIFICRASSCSWGADAGDDAVGVLPATVWMLVVMERWSRCFDGGSQAGRRRERKAGTC